MVFALADPYGARDLPYSNPGRLVSIQFGLGDPRLGIGASQTDVPSLASWQARTDLFDGLAAFDWLSARSESGIVLLGQSLGSGVAVNTAAERPARGVVLVSAYLSVMSLAQTHYPYLPVAPLIKDTFRSDLRIGKVGQPKLFIHGRRDDIIPLSSGEALYALAPEPKSLLIYDDYGHNDIWNAGIAGEIIGFVETLHGTGG